MAKRHLLVFLIIMSSCILFSCGGNNAKSHAYAGTFITTDSVRFELRNDSTTRIIFPNQISYESTWMVVTDKDGMQWANIEFAGNQRHYYLKDGQLYRSERNMRHNFLGIKIEYKD